MVVLHSFLGVYSLRTGSTVSLVLSLVSLVIFLILGLSNEKSRETILEFSTIILYIMWLIFTMMGFIGVYVERSTFLIPELSRRVLFIVLDIMGAIATYFRNEIDINKVSVPEIGVQWYTVASADDTLYIVLLVLFLLTIPIKLYLFVVMLSYYIHIKEDDTYHEATPRPRSRSRTTTVADE
ncbi:uncharacterized protein LOC135845063 [Planococcus citri]|uniref:uncharacterized protein LOC135845063 n=1 Tax=Planococcus citri TaxID=170843 RepID=UPI0031F815E8